MLYGLTEFEYSDFEKEPEDENCPYCESNRRRFSHYDTIEKKDFYRCNDCDEIYSL